MNNFLIPRDLLKIYNVNFLICLSLKNEDSNLSLEWEEKKLFLFKWEAIVSLAKCAELNQWIQKIFRAWTYTQLQVHTLLIYF
jgi:hypothetical protein